MDGFALHLASLGYICMLFSQDENYSSWDTILMGNVNGLRQ